MLLKNMNIDKFVKYIRDNDKEVICLGAGRVLRNSCKKYGLHKYIKNVLDNDESKWGYMHVEKTLLKIAPICMLESLISEKTVLLISASIGKGGWELYHSINELSFLARTECYALSLMMLNIYKYDDFRNIIDLGINLHLSDKPIIPRKIHYCWFGGGDIPEGQRDFIDGWKKKCPDFEIIRWDESNYDVKQNKYMWEAYKAGKWGFVPDFARKDIIYRYGGIYLDTDVEILKSLDDLIYQDGFAGFQYDNYVNLGMGFGARPGLDIIREMRDVYNHEEFGIHNGILKTGPQYETEILEKHHLKRNGCLQNVEGLTVYPINILSCDEFYTGEKWIWKNTHTIHHFAGSWIGKDAQEFRMKIRFFLRIIQEDSFDNSNIGSD